MSCALSTSAPACFAARLTAVRAKRGDAPLLQFGVHDCMRLRQVLDEPGIDLAIDLWAGPGAYERLADAAAGWVGK